MKTAREIIMRSMFQIWDENHPDAMPEYDDKNESLMTFSETDPIGELAL